MIKFLSKTYLYLFAIPFLFIGLGAASNQAVLIANHDRFPVLVNNKKLAELMAPKVTQDDFSILDTHVSKISKIDPDGMIDDTHCVMVPSSHLKALADIFDFKDAIVSVGDMMAEAGFWLLQFAPVAWVALAFRKLLVG